MTSPLELGLDCKPQIHSTFVKLIDDQAAEQTLKLEEFVGRLEEERLKIDAFKRELPLCMQLITNTMEAFRLQIQSHRKTDQATKPLLEEFIPLKNLTSSATDQGSISEVKANSWIWSQESNKGSKSMDLTPSQGDGEEADIKLALNGEQRSVIDAEGTTRTLYQFSSAKEGFPELALASPCKEMSLGENKGLQEMREQNMSAAAAEKEMGSTNGNHQRKARRCWSPDLHRRFVNALHMLGGSQVATPKQIRELMKVDGLTNDEVKSHLQKYRLHTRRPSPSPQGAVTTAPQVVVLGGIWVPQEYGGGGPAAALYGAHAATTHHHMPPPPPFCSATPPRPQEIFPAIAPSPNHHHHHQIYMYNSNNNSPPAQQRKASPESDVKGGTGGSNQSESIEDVKSESGGSWKADSGGREI